VRRLAKELVKCPVRGGPVVALRERRPIPSGTNQMTAKDSPFRLKDRNAKPDFRRN
jgi:hypothetical protein